MLYKFFCKSLAIKNAKSVFYHSFAKNAFCEPSAIMCHPLIKTPFYALFCAFYEVLRGR